MEYFDSTARAGFYGVAGGKVAHHTYVILEQGGHSWGFPCFGGLALHEQHRGATRVEYPASLWTPYMLQSQNVGTTLPANLFVALGMAQCSLSPAGNWTVADWESYWDENPVEEGIACHTGLAYGVSGVCHQATNRILWASRQGDFTTCPVNWPPSFSASYWVYGYYGKLTEGVATDLASALVAKARAGASAGGRSIASMSTDQGPDEELNSALGSALREGLRRPQERAERQLELEQILGLHHSGGLGVAAASMGSVVDCDQAFSQTKRELDQQLLRGEITNQAYAESLNQAFDSLVVELRDRIPAERFGTLFPEHAAGQHPALVRPELMPKSYDSFQALAKI